MIILGIDPGSRRTGYGVIEVPDPGSKSRDQRVVEFGVLDVTDSDDAHLRLQSVYHRVSDVIARRLPDECAIEMPVYGKNAQAMLKLGRAQAAAILAALNNGVPVAQYTPKEVKKSVTGNGAADKQQVRYMVRTLLTITSNERMSLDSADALAIGLCHAHRRRSAPNGVTRSWEAFVSENPDRIVRPARR